MALPHFTNSTAAMNNFEPVYLNLFEVTITPPEGFPITDFALIMENVKKVSGLEIDKMPPLVEQIYRGAKRRYPGALPDTTTVDVNIEWEVNINDQNQMYIYDALRFWCDSVWDTQTGARGLKKDIVGKQLTIIQHNKAGEVFREISFPNPFPMSALPPLELDYSSGTNIYSVNLTFACDYWRDSRA